MAESVIVAIHGVGNRDEEKWIEREVRPLAEALGRTVGDDLLPVFWGDLAPVNTSFASIPLGDEGLPLAVVTEALSGNGHRPSDEAVDALTERVMAEVEKRAGEVRAIEAEAAVREAIAETRVTTDRVVEMPELAEALAEVVLATDPAGTAEISLGFPAQQLKKAMRSVIGAVDRGLGRELGKALQALLRDREAGLAATFAKTAGDVLCYSRAGSASARMRGRLDTVYQQAAAKSSHVHLIAHSLGAYIATEWLLGAPAVCEDGQVATAQRARVADVFVTFGAQVALFSELYGLAGEGEDVWKDRPLPIHVNTWANVWHQLDPLAFVFSRVLRFGEGDGEAVHDFRLELASIPDDLKELSVHGAYWKDERFQRWLRDQLAGV